MIRHGATDSPAALNGRTDVGLAEQPSALSFDPGMLWVSPARRARETAEGMFPGRDMREDARLWEQDFGVWDGKPFSELPDTGRLTLDELAQLRADDGESHVDMLARVQPALEEAVSVAISRSARVTIVAHAGTVRAALALAMKAGAATLAFQIEHLRATRFRCYSGGMAVRSVNETLA